MPLRSGVEMSGVSFSSMINLAWMLRFQPTRQGWAALSVA
jgi:hypothetical protein